MRQTTRAVLPKTVATAWLLGTIALTGVTMSAAPAQAATSVRAATTTPAPIDGDPVAQDGNDDSGKWGLAGLTGLVGLFGYKKYRDQRATPNAHGSTRA